ncbi:uncharacterized protein LOC112559106 isoform X4 [Pomacea canaliculata]|uniref:uncharacterized protein LOC112559106 isoform X4 n=1 Tax=Pomacea canaliculata TaxID=400727 RepID=UPI000D72E1B0|nr:uncharacterized protein LOC112559106 isoform X4 [Pomacea canaliculata]
MASCDQSEILRELTASSERAFVRRRTIGSRLGRIRPLKERLRALGAGASCAKGHQFNGRDLQRLAPQPSLLPDFQKNRHYCRKLKAHLICGTICPSPSLHSLSSTQSHQLASCRHSTRHPDTSTVGAQHVQASRLAKSIAQVCPKLAVALRRLCLTHVLRRLHWSAQSSRHLSVALTHSVPHLYCRSAILPTTGVPAKIEGRVQFAIYVTSGIVKHRKRTIVLTELRRTRLAVLVKGCRLLPVHTCGAATAGRRTVSVSVSTNFGSNLSAVPFVQGGPDNGIPNPEYATTIRIVAITVISVEGTHCQSLLSCDRSAPQTPPYQAALQ